MSGPSNSWAIETHALTKRYGPFDAVRAIDLKVARGGIIGFLGFKAWQESKLRFLPLAAATVAASAAVVLFHEPMSTALATRQAPLDTYSGYIYRVTYQGYIKTLFTICAFVLGLGGLVREQELGTAAFTLSLPVSRLRLIMVRAASGLMQLAVLALLPAIIILALSPLVHKAYPATQALQFALLWMAAGSAHFAVAFVASAMLGGEYTAFVVSWIVLFTHTVGIQYVRLTHPALKPCLLTLPQITSGFGMSYFDPTTHLLVGPFPIVIVLFVAAAASALIAAAALSTHRRDF